MSIPSNEVDRLLEKQRLMYEAKRKELRSQRQQNTSATPPTPSQGSVPSNEVDCLLEQQRLMYEAKLKELQTQQQQNTSTAPPTRSQRSAMPLHQGKYRSYQSPFQPDPLAPLPPDFREAILSHQRSYRSHQSPFQPDPVDTIHTFDPFGFRQGIPSPQRPYRRDQSPFRPDPLALLPQGFREAIVSHQRPYRSKQSSLQSDPFTPLPVGFREVISETALQPPSDILSLSRANQSTGVLNHSRDASSSRHSQPSGRSTSTENKTGAGCDIFASEFSYRPKPKSTDDEEFNCRTCKNKYGLYIYQCGRGHSSCKDCKTKGARCGVCGETLTDTRNFTLEDYISEKPIACSNADDGCCLNFKVSEMEAHLKECPFNPSACPVAAIFGTCPWKGKISKMASHFDDAHPEHRQGAIDSEMIIHNMSTTNSILHLVQIGPYNFLVHVKVDEKENNVYMTVQLFGTSVSAAKWTYEIHIYAEDGISKYQYTDICHPMSISVEDIFKEAKCLSIPLWYAVNFVECGCLAYKFNLKKVVHCP